MSRAMCGDVSRPSPLPPDALVPRPALRSASVAAPSRASSPRSRAATASRRRRAAAGRARSTASPVPRAERVMAAMGWPRGGCVTGVDALCDAPPNPLVISHVLNPCDTPSLTATLSQGPWRGNGSQSPLTRGLYHARDRKARATGHTKHTATLAASALLDPTPHPAVSFSWGLQSTGASQWPTFFCLRSRHPPCCGWHAICA